MRVNPGFVVQHVLDDLIEFLFNQCYRYFHGTNAFAFATLGTASGKMHGVDHMIEKFFRKIATLRKPLRRSGLRNTPVPAHTKRTGIAACITANAAFRFLLEQREAFRRRQGLVVSDGPIGRFDIALWHRISQDNISPNGVAVATACARIVQHIGML